MSEIEEFVRSGGKTLSVTLQIGRQPNKKFLDDEGNFCDEPYVEGLTEEDKVEDFDTTVYILNEKTQVCKLKTHCIVLLRNVSYSLNTKRKRMHELMHQNLSFCE